MNRRFTFHVSLTLIYDEGIAPATPSLISDNSYPFDGAKAFKVSPKISFGCIFVLVESVLIKPSPRKAWTYKTCDK